MKRTNIKLNVAKVELALQILHKNQSWLAEQIGCSRQLLSYWMKKKAVNGIIPIAKAIGLEPIELLILE